MDNAIFVERDFELSGRSLKVRFYVPKFIPGEEYSCVFTIDWPDDPQTIDIRGLDGMQALLLAMRHARERLIGSDAYRAGQLTYLGQKELDWMSIDE